MYASSFSIQVTYDIAWIPNQDQRYYDYVTIANNYTDFVFVMSYDERSQIYGPCIAWANSAINNTIYGEFAGTCGLYLPVVCFCNM